MEEQPIDRPPVYDLLEWRTRPASRQTRPARALWNRAAGHHRIEPHPSPHVRTRPVPGAATPMAPSAPVAIPDPVLLVTCVESQVVDRLRAALPASALLRNLGGLVPRSARAPRAAADVDVIESAFDRVGVRHVVCVGHLGCHATHATTRYASSVPRPGGARDRAVRAIEHHVFMQMHHVRAYLRRRAQHPVVRVSGLWVDEASGHVQAFDPARRAFAPLGDFDLARYSVTVPERPAPRLPHA